MKRYAEDKQAAKQARKAAKKIIERYYTTTLETIAQHPTNVIAHFNLGILLKAKGDMKGAEAEYRTAIAIADHPGAHTNLTLLLKQNAALLLKTLPRP